MSKAKSKSSKLNLDLKINSELNDKLKNEIKKHNGIHCDIICQNIVSFLLQLHCREFPHLIIRSSLHSCFVFYGLDVPELNIA